MKLIIDSADFRDIEKAVSLGITGITANASLYRKAGISMLDYLTFAERLPYRFLSAEVMGSYEEMLQQAIALNERNRQLVIKINFSEDGLRLATALRQKGIPTAMTLIFSVTQAVLAAQAGCQYLFCFVSRNDEAGNDGLQTVMTIAQAAKDYATAVVAASVRNVFQLEMLATGTAAYAAVPLSLIERVIANPLSEQGLRQFEKDWHALAYMP